MLYAICTSVIVIVQYTECNQTCSAKLGIALSLTPVSPSPSYLRTSWITRGFIFCHTSLPLNATSCCSEKVLHLGPFPTQQHGEDKQVFQEQLQHRHPVLTVQVCDERNEHSIIWLLHCSVPSGKWKPLCERRGSRKPG